MIKKDCQGFAQPEGFRFKIADADDCISAASEAMNLARTAGLSSARRSMFATAVSELATNIWRYAVAGEITIRAVNDATRKGVEVVAEDRGPGIADIKAALEDGFSTRETSLGIGLGGVKRLMDEFTITSEPGTGTCIMTRKWGKSLQTGEDA
jgi:serine/threonine-protein kinase RsbT